MKKNWIALLLAALMLFSLMAGCTTKPTDPAPSDSAEPSKKPEAAKGSVYYLNFKPEQADQWVALAEKYTKETGVPVQVTTAASGTYEATLMSEIAKTKAPTLFQVNGPVGLSNWKDYCYDLANSNLYKELKSDDFALKEGNTVYGVAYVIETYGLIYNKAILTKYCALPNAKIKAAADINSCATLKAVAEDMQARKAELGIKGAFTSTGMDSSSDWRFKTHLANLPVYYEYQKDGITTTTAIKGTYLDNYKNIFDLYINNSTCEPSMISAKTGDDANSEFALGEAAFYQNGTWAYGDLTKAGMADADIGIMPIYIGAEGEENQGLCTGSENYWCVNKNASEDDIQATLDFVNWCVTADAGKTGMMDMGFVCPFKGFTPEFMPVNPLLTAADESIAAGKKPVLWCFPTMPSEEWKNGVGSALLEYAQGSGKWDGVKTAFVDNWAKEYALKAETPAK
ncbi:MAG: ABC transporter substrate-binding protein [Oscillospiraceae bacterium]